MDSKQKYFFRKEISYLVRGVIWYFIITMLVSRICLELLQREQINEDIAMGLASIGSVTTGVVVLFIRNILFDKRTGAFEKTKKMELSTFVQSFSLILMIQFLFLIITNLIEVILNYMGVTMKEAVDLASGSSNSGITMLLYAGIIGPVAEEIVFRGLVLKGFQKYGKSFALICTSVIFGLGHLNPIQIGLAIPMGMILGYITIEYSIKYAILLHIINNLILGNAVAWFLDQLPEEIAYVLFYGILMLGFVMGVMVLKKNYRKLKEWFIENTAKKHCYRYVVTLPSVVVLGIFDVGISLTMIILLITTL